MPKICDNKSVGMIIKKGDKILLIERKKFPFGFAPPAGHLDGDTYERSAKRELEEEVGLTAKNLKLIYKGKKENPCRRQNGSWHYWKIYSADFIGEIKRSKEETKQAGWYSPIQIRNLANGTELYGDKIISDEEWQKSPGLELVWYEFFKELKIII
jgi:ADP-ribose pyrophosphatase YjhB (NUDIX family)